MGVRLNVDEAWEVLSAAHTGILTSMRRDGSPITLPMWFVTLDRTICFGTPPRSKKVARLRNDPRASFLVESGERWAELQAVHLSGVTDVVVDETEVARIESALDKKYAPFRTQQADMSDATQKHYAQRAYYRLTPDERFLSWDNRRLGV